MPEPWPPVDAPVQSQQPQTGEWRAGVDGRDRVQRCPAKESVSPLGGPPAGAAERFIEEVVVVEGDAIRLVCGAVAGEGVEVVLGNAPLPGAGEAVEKRPLEFREQEPVLVGGILVEVVRHELVEPGHQALDVDKTVGVLVPLPFEQSAGVRQAADPVHKAVVVEVVDEQGRVRNKRARETGAGNEHMVRRGSRRHVSAQVASDGTEPPVRQRWRNRVTLAVSPTPRRRGGTWVGRLAR